MSLYWCIGCPQGHPEIICFWKHERFTSILRYHFKTYSFAGWQWGWLVLSPLIHDQGWDLAACNGGSLILPKRKKKTFGVHIVGTGRPCPVLVFWGSASQCTEERWWRHPGKSNQICQRLGEGPRWEPFVAGGVPLCPRCLGDFWDGRLNGSLKFEQEARE